MPEMALRAERVWGLALAMERMRASERIMKAGVLVGRACSVRQWRRDSKRASALAFGGWSALCDPTRDDDAVTNGAPRLFFFLGAASARLPRIQTVSRARS